MAIALVTGNITYNSGTGTAQLSGNIAISPAMTSGQYLVVLAASGGATNIGGANLQPVAEVTVVGASTTVAMFSLLRATGNVGNFNISVSAVAGLSAVASVFSATNKLRIDTSSGGNTTSASIATLSAATTAQANELWIGGAAMRLLGGATFSAAQIGGANADNTYQTTTNIGSTSDRAGALWLRSVAATGSPNATATANASGIYCAQVICLEETPAAGGGLRAAGHGGLAA